MSFTRALSRRGTASRGSSPNRTMSVRKAIKRSDISLPVTLLSTSNMLAYEAPDIATLRARGFSNATDSSRSSSDETPGTPNSTEPALTEGSSVSSSPAIEHNHLSAYFPGPTIKDTALGQKTALADLEAPVIPQRAPSHSKREHERVARTRSLRRSASGSLESTPKPPQSEVFDTNPPHMSAPKTHPFGQELNQLSEVAEEYHHVARSVEQEQDLAFMKMNGLRSHKPQDYVNLIWPSNPFEIDLPQEDNIGGWI